LIVNADKCPDCEGEGLVDPRRPFHEKDLRYHHHESRPKPESNAVIINIMDSSGSMDMMKKYLARSFFYLLYLFIRSKYARSELIFIAHHTEAKEVTEDEFFRRGDSGGTFMSSGYKKALEIIHSLYHPSLWNVYVVYCSDGDNFDSDNPEAIKALQELTNVCNFVGYGEIKPKGSVYYEGSMLTQFQEKIKASNYLGFKITGKEDVYPKFRELLSKDRAVIND
jgi:uncharacterized sporulation protein YeaH/YhbH (DUF444 family)